MHAGRLPSPAPFVPVPPGLRLFHHCLPNTAMSFRPAGSAQQCSPYIDCSRYAHMNHVSLQMEPETPSLLERLSNNPDGIPPPAITTEGLGWNIVDIQAGEVVQVTIYNYDDGEHPVCKLDKTTSTNSLESVCSLAAVLHVCCFVGHDLGQDKCSFGAADTWKLLRWLPPPFGACHLRGAPLVDLRYWDAPCCGYLFLVFSGTGCTPYVGGYVHGPDSFISTLHPSACTRLFADPFALPLVLGDGARAAARSRQPTCWNPSNSVEGPCCARHGDR